MTSAEGLKQSDSLLFATTNHIERLDPALSRPGRMDVWVNFKHATKWQAEGIFKCFFPARPLKSAESPSPSAPAKAGDDPTSTEGLAVPKRKRAAHAIPLLSEDEISELAKRFAGAIPEDELSVAALQGYLLKNKTRPRECVDEVADWVVKERETRAKLKKEKEEREAKEKKENEESEAKEKKEAAEKKKEKAADSKLTKENSAATAESEKDSTSVGAEGTTDSNSSDAESDDTLLPGNLEESTTSTQTTEADPDPSVASDDEGEQSDKEAAQVDPTNLEKWVALKGHPPDTLV